MAQNWICRTGDCLSSIGQQTGFFWKTLWDHPQNSEVRQARQDPNVLMEGDVVHVPDKRRKEEPGATEQLHRFRRKGEPVILRIAVLECGEPRANEPYALEIDGRVHQQGTLGADGELEVLIRGNARRGTLYVGPERDPHDLQLGAIAPLSELAGVKGRLNNLGFQCGPADGGLDEHTRLALRRFQEQHKLAITGEPDEATRNRLRAEHKS